MLAYQCIEMVKSSQLRRNRLQLVVAQVEVVQVVQLHEQLQRKTQTRSNSVEHSTQQRTHKQQRIFNSHQDRNQERLSYMNKENKNTMPCAKQRISQLV